MLHRIYHYAKVCFIHKNRNPIHYCRSYKENSVFIVNLVSASHGSIHFAVILCSQSGDWERVAKKQIVGLHTRYKSPCLQEGIPNFNDKWAGPPAAIVKD